MSATK